MEELHKDQNKDQKFSKLTFLSWIVAFVATLGSLFFSEVMKFPPCSLCWYQRIAMYPLVLLFVVGFFIGEKETFFFTLPLVLIGWIFSIYHNLLHFGVIPETLSPCLEGVPCTSVYIELFGFLTIPLMSFLSFSLILILLFFLYRSSFEK